MSRLANILQQEYKTKGLIGGAASSLGKRSLEKLDIRNALFSGGGVGSIIGTKIFGKGYSATRGAGTGKTTSPNVLTSDSSSLLQDININSKITAKNSMALPAMAKQMNIMQKNIAKLVTTFGEKPSTKADSFFSNAKFRENQYESQFSSNKKPTRVETKEKSNSGFGILGVLGSVVGGISSAISSAISGIATVITSAVTTLGSTITSAITALGTVLGAALLGKSISSIPSILPGSKPGGPGGTTPPAKKSGAPGTTQPAKKPGFLMTAEEKIAENKAKQMAAEKGAARAAATRMTARTFGRAALGAVTGPIGGAFLTATMLYDIANLLSPSELNAVETHTQTLESIQEDVDELIKNYNEGKITEDGYNRALQGLAKKAETVKQKLDALKKQILKRMQDEGQDTSSVKEAFSKSEKRIGSLEQERLQALQSAPGSGSLISSTSPSRDSNTGASTSPTPANGSSNLLDIIAGGESGSMGYDAANKGKAGDTPGGMPGLSNMKVGDVMRLQQEKKLFAAGRYQIIPNTLAGLISGKYGNTGVSLNDTFDAATQDKLAQALINKRLQQGGDDPIKQQYALSQEFASIANPYTNSSYYDKVGNNKASIGTSTIQAALTGSPSATVLASNRSSSGEALAAASGNSFESSKNMFTPEDLASLASIMGGQTMIGGGGGLNQVSMASKATPYPKEFYNGLITANALG